MELEGIKSVVYPSRRLCLWLANGRFPFKDAFLHLGKPALVLAMAAEMG